MSNNAHFEPPAHEVFGPQGTHVVALIDRARHLTPGEASALNAPSYAARDAARDAVVTAAGASARRYDALTVAWDAMLDAAWDAAWDDDAWDATWGTSWGGVLDAARALIVRDLITTEDYDTLTRPWREVIGPIHPEDEFWAAVAKAAK